MCLPGFTAPKRSAATTEHTGVAGKVPAAFGVGPRGRPQVSVQSADANLGHRNEKTGEEKNRPGACPGPIQKSKLPRIIE